MKTRDLFGFMVVHMMLSEHNKEHSIRDQFLYDHCKDIIAELDLASQREMVDAEERYNSKGGDPVMKTNYFHYNTTSIKYHSRAKHFIGDILKSFNGDFDQFIKDVEALQSEQEQLVAAK
mgnify:CR=1 FL=1